MKSVFCLLLSVLFVSFAACGSTRFNHILPVGNTVWALTETGSIIVFESRNGKVINTPALTDTDIILLTKDSYGNPVTANKRKEIKRYIPVRRVWELIGTYDLPPLGVVVDSRGGCFTITEKGIQDVASKQVYFDTHSINRQITLRDKWFGINCFYIDKQDVIWIGFDYGEWGGNLFAFQTPTRTFSTLSLIDVNLELMSIKQFTGNDSSVYIITRKDHMETGSTIIKADQLKLSTLFSSQPYWSDPIGPRRSQIRIQGEGIEAASFNPFTNQLYFYTSHCLFRSQTNKDLSTLDGWENLMPERARKQTANAAARPVALRLISLEMTGKNRFIFLTHNHLAGWSDGKTIHYFIAED